MKAHERLLKYVTYMTPSDENSDSSPSSACQFDLARVLARELQTLGVTNAFVSEYCYVYGRIPATPGCEDVTPIGFIAHMDTVARHCDHPVSPIVTPDYDGGPLPLGESGRVLSPEMFPHLRNFKGRTLITSDGTTILGADDKAGIAEIMTMVERLTGPHGPISIAFTPDEEIGRGTAKFDFAAFGAKYAYTVDGDFEGELDYETFNAAAALVRFTGVDVHPGDAKDVMVNAARVAMEYDTLIPMDERPERTDGRQGFYHLVATDGTPDSAMLTYIIRDHDRKTFERRQGFMRDMVEVINRKYGEGTASIDIRLQYRNMADIIAQNPIVLDKAKEAMAGLSITPIIKPVRGGTDGSLLSYKGLPCPNLGTGGHAFHGPYEHITVEGMDTVVDILLAIVRAYL
ncbi:MAG: peptidase T [Mogibacterium sp.]|nr:peptidase T [Mogibacterium sp.]